MVIQFLNKFSPDLKCVSVLLCETILLKITTTFEGKITQRLLTVSSLLFFWYQLTRIVSVKGPLNGCVFIISVVVLLVLNNELNSLQ